METKKVLSIIFSILFIGVFAFVLSWGIVNFNKVKDGMSSSGVYTKEDIDNAYKDGYSTALENEKSYTELIDNYRDTITTQTDTISQLNSQVTTLTNNNKDYSNQIINLTSQKVDLENQVSNLIIIKEDNESLITDLNNEIKVLEQEVTELINSNYNKSQEIAQKNSQISNLQNTVNQLQKTNELNVQTINNLNNQITTLNSQISEMTLQIQNNSANVSVLNNKIADLEKSVAYYEQYIASLENGEQVVATFEFDGSVYNIQIVNPNSIITVTEPTSSNYIVFNGWTVNGEQVDLSTYQINTNTKFVADVTYKYDTNFMVDETVYNSQIVVENDYPILPDNPIKHGYEFDGWTSNNVDIVNPEIISISQNTIYYAKFTKLHSVTFVYEDATFETQTIRNGSNANNVFVDNTTYKQFNGWTINGAIVDLSSYKIVADTTFIADITYCYDVTFIVDNDVYNTQIVQNNNYAVLPIEIPQKDRYEFVGWSLDGVNVIDISNTPITNNINFICVWVERIGFDGTYFNVENFPSQFSNKWETNEYFGYFANGYIYLINKTTFELTYYNINAVPALTSTIKNSYFVYDGNICFVRSGYNMLYKFDLTTKTATCLLNDTIFKKDNATFGIYENKILVVGKNSSSQIGYYTYDINTNVKSEVTIIGNNITEISLNSCIVHDNYLYIKLNCSYPNKTTTVDDYWYIFNITNGSYDVINIPAYVEYGTYGATIRSCSFYEVSDGIYLTVNGTIAKYDYNTRTLSSFEVGSYTSYPLVIDDLAYIFDSSNKRIICRNLVTGDETYFDYPYAEGSTRTAYEFIKIDDNKYIIRFKTTYNGNCFVYFYV